MKKAYITMGGVVGTSKKDYIDAVFTNKREAEKYVKVQNDYWNSVYKKEKKELWVHWIIEKQLRSKAILR